MPALKARDTVSQDYSLMIIIQARLDITNTNAAPIISNHGQWCLRHKRSLFGKGHLADFTPCHSILLLGISTLSQLCNHLRGLIQNFSFHAESHDGQKMEYNVVFFPQILRLSDDDTVSDAS